MNIIKLMEEKHGAVCDEFSQDGRIIKMLLRVVRDTFEYSCRLTVDEGTMNVIDYEFAASWHLPRPEVKKSPAPQKVSIVLTPDGQKRGAMPPARAQDARPVIRRRVLTPA